jgi:transcriptional regulator with GAF, ATPase, and Fis domain
VRQERPADGDRGRPSTQDTGTSTGQDGLAAQFADLARSLQRQSDPEATLRDVVRAAVMLIPGVDEGSISVVMGRRHVMSQAPSAELPRLVDALQEQTGQGPCLDAVYEQETVRVSDMSTEQRWPQFAARAAAAGAGGMLSLQLFVEGDNLGALNLYSRRAGTVNDESEHVGRLFAAHAAVAFAAARREADLDRALATSRLIGQAQGIVMERHKITGEDAFALLVAASQRRNVKVRDLAEVLVRSGVLDEGQS